MYILELEINIRKKCSNWVAKGYKLGKRWEWGFDHYDLPIVKANNYYELNPLLILADGEEIIDHSLSGSICKKYNIGKEDYNKLYEGGYSRCKYLTTHISNVYYMITWKLMDDYLAGRKLYECTKCKYG